MCLCPFATLSNGERTKGAACGFVFKENSFLLIDEPTNHLDMEGCAGEPVFEHKTGLYSRVLSHDRAFLDACIDHTLSINKTNIVVQKRKLFPLVGSQTKCRTLTRVRK